MITRLLASAALVATASLSMPAQAQADDAVGWNFDGVPAWTNERGDEFTFRGRVYLDAANVDFETGGVTTEFNDSEIRTARLGITGRTGSVRYVAEFDWINDRIIAKDAYLTFVNEGFSVLVGHMKTPNSIDEQTSSRYITFMERGTGTDLFGLDRRVGIAITSGGDNYSLRAGVYGGRPGDLSESLELDDSSAIAARATFTPVNDDTRIVHLGASVRRMDYGGAGTRVRVRPQTHITDRVVTADFRPGRPLGEADTSFFVGLEFAMVQGSVHIEAEHMNMSVEGPAGDPDFSSSYIQGGWFITGEQRSYSASSGRFGRTRPARALSEGGAGAWEIAARYDVSDLNDVAAGELRTWTAGVNWYVEDKIRVMANIVSGELDVTGGANTDVSGAQMRIQWDF